MASPSADTAASAGSLTRSGALPLAGVVVAAIGVAALANPATIEDGPVICPFRLMTGLPCPGCGLTRSWVYLVHGQWHDAFAANPFGPILLLLCIGYVAAVVVALLRRRPPPDLERALRNPVLYAFGAAWVLFGVVRLIDVAMSR